MRRTVRSENIVNQVHKQPSRRTPRLLEGPTGTNG
jgi:hypothetical protein